MAGVHIAAFEARSVFRSAVVRSCKYKVRGSYHPDVAAHLNKLAVAYASRGSYAEAEGRYRHALSIREQAIGASNSDARRSIAALAR
jgi:Tetratricopeptide repeat